MSVKDKRDFRVRFYAEKEVRAYTMDDARNQVESMNNIKPEKAITTMSYADAFADSLLLNIGGLLTMSVSIFYAVFMFGIFQYISKIEDPAMLLTAMMVWVILFFATFRFPRTIDRYYKRHRYD